MWIAAIHWKNVTTSLPLLNCMLSGTLDTAHHLKRFCDSRTDKVGTHRSKVCKKNLSYQALLCKLGRRKGLKEGPTYFHASHPTHDYYHHSEGLETYAALWAWVMRVAEIHHLVSKPSNHCLFGLHIHCSCICIQVLNEPPAVDLDHDLHVLHWISCHPALSLHYAASAPDLGLREEFQVPM